MTNPNDRRNLAAEIRAYALDGTIDAEAGDLDLGRASLRRCMLRLRKLSTLDVELGTPSTVAMAISLGYVGKLADAIAYAEAGLELERDLACAESDRAEAEADRARIA